MTYNYEIKKLPQVQVGAEAHEVEDHDHQNRRSLTLLLMDNTTNTFGTVRDHLRLSEKETDLVHETTMTTLLVADGEGVSLVLQESDHDLVMTMMIVPTKSRRKRVMNQDRSLQLRNRREREILIS